MPASITFGDGAGAPRLNAAAYLIHAHADLAGANPKLIDVFVYVLATVPNESPSALFDPTRLTGEHALTIFWSGDNFSTHVFGNIHLQETVAAFRTQNHRSVLLRFGYRYVNQVPTWLDQQGACQIKLNYPATHNNDANYKKPVLGHGTGAVHALDIVGAEPARGQNAAGAGGGAPAGAGGGADPQWNVATGARPLVAFEYATGSGMAALAGGTAPAPERLTMIGYRNNQCRVFNVLLEQDRIARGGQPAQPAAGARPAAGPAGAPAANPVPQLKLKLPGTTTEVPVTLATAAPTRLVYVEHRNFWPTAVWGDAPWSAPLIPTQDTIAHAGIPEFGTVGDVVNLSARALRAKDIDVPGDVGLEATVLALSPASAALLAAVRA